MWGGCGGCDGEWDGVPTVEEGPAGRRAASPVSERDAQQPVGFTHLRPGSAPPALLREGPFCGVLIRVSHSQTNPADWLARAPAGKGGVESRAPQGQQGHQTLARPGPGKASGSGKCSGKLQPVS